MAKSIDLLIVGAGPSGIAAAIEAKRQGLLKIKILEKGPSHSSMIRTYYKEGKRVDAKYAGLEPICFGVMCLRDGNRESFLSFIDHAIQVNQVDISFGCEVWGIEKQTEGNFFVKSSRGDFLARAVVIAIGKMGKPNTPEYWSQVPPTLKNNKTLLFDINTRELAGQKVLVIGGGDSASEYVDMLHRSNEVSWSYRQVVLAKMNDVNRNIVETLIANEKVEAMLGSHVVAIEEDNAKPRVKFAEEALGSRTFDAVLFALGGITPVAFLKNVSIEVTEKGEAKVDSESCETSVKGLYIVGDLLGKGRGGGSIIAGFNSAHQAVRSLSSQYFGLPILPDEVGLEHLKY